MYLYLCYFCMQPLHNNVMLKRLQLLLASRIGYGLYTVAHIDAIINERPYKRAHKQKR